MENESAQTEFDDDQAMSSSTKQSGAVEYQSAQTELDAGQKERISRAFTRVLEPNVLAEVIRRDADGKPHEYILAPLGLEPQDENAFAKYLQARTFTAGGEVGLVWGFRHLPIIRDPLEP